MTAAAAAATAASVVAGPGGFSRELRRWRTTRRWSQLDLAIHADTTQRYVSFLEQGRSRPGRAMVVRLAETLGLTLRERNGLLLAAGYAPVFAESDLDDPELRPVREALAQNTIHDQAGVNSMWSWRRPRRIQVGSYS